ncbi:hypothetical protein LF817_17525 [Halobacillus sp. A1]|uniref:hypothetical protein n=1 Tax=Halobacillus sp. A1 TaxID=2880262 RepID=UPI0020A64690|nr:hypothetical protein [Halobacillus sp. A1]MCP3033128.1 hypothetical protein [Halobacillus sp. A1]
MLKNHKTSCVPGESSIGIFHKTDAIIHANTLKAWVEDSKNPSLIRVKDEIQTMTLHEIVESMTFSPS